MFRGHNYGSNYHQIDEHLQTLDLGSRPHSRGVGNWTYHNFGDCDNFSNAFSNNNFFPYSTIGTRASNSHEYDQSYISSNIASQG